MHEKLVFELIRMVYNANIKHVVPIEWLSN